MRRFLILSMLAAVAWKLFIPAHYHMIIAVQWLVAGLTEATGLPATSGTMGLMTFDGGFAYAVTTACTGMNMVFMYAAAVLAYPAPLRGQLVGLAIGIPALLVANVVRLVAMAHMGVHASSVYEDFHLFWAQGLLVIGVGLAWLAWITWVQRRGKTTSARLDLSGIAAASGMFVLMFVALALVGVMGASTPYARIILATADALGPLIGRTIVPAPEGAVQYFGTWWFGATAATAALYLATPRASLGRRVRYAATLAVPSTFISHVAWVIARSGPPVGGDYIISVFLLFMLQMMIPLTVWAIWAIRENRQWQTDQEAIQPTTCPECLDEHEDLQAHLESVHAHYARRLMNRATRRSA